MMPTASQVFILSATFVLVWWFASVRSFQLSLARKFALVTIPVIWASIVLAIAKEDWFKTESTPPRVLLPVGVSVLLCTLLWRGGHIHRLSRLSYFALIALSLVRIPVEWVLHQLYLQNLVPLSMTWSGYNFDILSGLAALALVVILATKGFSIVSETQAIKIFAWGGFGLLLAIIVQAFLSVPGPLHIINANQPNLAVLQYPFVLLPTLIVPFVLVSHLAIFAKLYSGQNKKRQ